MKIWKRHRTSAEVLAMAATRGIEVDTTAYDEGGDHLVLMTMVARVLYNTVSGRFFGTAGSLRFCSDHDQPDAWYQALVEFFYTDEPAPLTLITTKLRNHAAEWGVTVEEKGPGHFQLRGTRLVNYWPLSKNSTAHVAGEMSGLKHATIEQAVALALEPIDPNESSTYTLFGRLVSKEEFDAHQMPPDDNPNPPWTEKNSKL